MITSNLSFHESTVVMFEHTADAVRLSLSDVKCGGRSRSVNVEIRNVTSIIVDGASVNGVAMEHDDGEVLTLNVSDAEILLIVQWNDFRNHSSVTKSYRIKGHVSVELSPRTIVGLN